MAGGIRWSDNDDGGWLGRCQLWLGTRVVGDGGGDGRKKEWWTWLIVVVGGVEGVSLLVHPFYNGE